ncbi:MAG: hypothetical protein DRJ33_08810 [Candidatus Methanomethylicota archaeon]|uniref:Uracil-DNA glycosylase-like domain-containing protein n=1 Tax=Thermoproteota archaeon TaxID=2056631 RepID=A0A497ENZ4_9CREN|nr:MAG: hypothetical protein DRJ33_08810 [Candidatus Verstraetearchaeota archaeon]
MVLLSASAQAIEEAISKCALCEYIDKPFVKHHVYHKWLPREVKVLAIGESPPPSKKESFFYNLRLFDRLRLSMRTILEFEGSGDDLLRTLRKRGVFITAAVKCRPLDRKRVADMCKACTHILEKEIALLRPSRVIAMGNTASQALSIVLKLAERYPVRQLYKTASGNLEVAFTPHPNYIFRFRRDLAKKVKSYLLE